MSKTNIADTVGNAKIDHFALLVQPGKMDIAVSFFVDEFGWDELADKRTDAAWGRVCFLEPYIRSTAILQLTELAADEPWGILPGVHLGLKVYDAKVAAHAVRMWAAHRSVRCQVEELQGGKWFVTLPYIFAAKIEFVSVGA